MLETACLFFAYGELQRVVARASGTPAGSPLSLGQLALAAAGSGTLTSFILCVHALPSCCLLPRACCRLPDVCITIFICSACMMCTADARAQHTR
jgi:hypothetical protein